MLALQFDPKLHGLHQHVDDPENPVAAPVEGNDNFAKLYGADATDMRARQPV